MAFLPIFLLDLHRDLHLCSFPDGFTIAPSLPYLHHKIFIMELPDYLSNMSFADRRQTEWTYDQAVQKVMHMLSLDDTKTECAKSAVRIAARADIDDPLMFWRFDTALRQCAKDDEAEVSPRTLVQALLRFYLEILGIDSVAATDAVSGMTGSALQCLDDMAKQGIIGFVPSRRASFFFIVEKCTPSVEKLMIDTCDQMSEAVRIGLSQNILSRPQAQVAELCLLIGLNPSEAKSHGAETDLPGAVANALATATDRLDFAIK